VTPLADGSVSFRLLTASLPAARLGGTLVTLVDAITVLGGEGGAEVPRITLEISENGRTGRVELEPFETWEGQSLRLRFDYLLSGEFPGLPVQSAAHFTLLR